MALTVNGREISAETIEQEIARLKPDYERYVNENGGEPDEDQLTEWATENLVEKELLRQEAERSQEQPDERRISAWLEENRDVFAEGLSDAERRALCIEDIKIRSLVKAVRKSVQPPSKEELRSEYESNRERFTVPESLRISHICRKLYLGVDKARVYIDLLDLKQRVESSELQWIEAVQLSDTYRDDFGMFEMVMRGVFPGDIEQKLFALERGQISDVIELGASVHLFKVLVKREAVPIPFADVCEDLSSMMFAEATENALNEMIDTLKTKADIHYA